MKKSEALLFQFADETKRDLIIKTLEGEKIACKVLPPDAYDATLGSLFNMKGFGRGKEEENFDFPHEVLLFKDVNGKRLDAALDAMKKVGIEKIHYKAVLTPTNAFWTLAGLCRRMEKEHRPSEA